MKQTVYIETTIISYLTARPSRIPLIAGQQAVSREWWDHERYSYDLFASELVYAEAAEGDPKAAAERISLLYTFPILSISQEAELLRGALVSELAMPAAAGEDALHVAIAAVNGVDYLLTWNCRHLANAVLRPRIEGVCRDAGYEPPIICTPLELKQVES